MARTDTLGHFLTDVADAIRTKKGTSDTIAAEDFDTEIENLPSGGGKYAPKFISFNEFYQTKGSEYNNLDYELANLDTSNITSMKKMFYSVGVTSLDLSNFDTSNVEDMQQMFVSCGATSLSFPSTFDTSKVRSMYFMFSTMRSLPGPLNISMFDLHNVTNAQFMFADDNVLTGVIFPENGFNSINTVSMGGGLFSACYQLNSLTNFKVSHIGNDINRLFYNCRSMESIDLSEVYPAQQITNISNAFYGCTSLQHLDIRNFALENVTLYSGMLGNVPTTCEIIVKDATSKTWMNTNFSSYTNVKTVAEYEAE